MSRTRSCWRSFSAAMAAAPLAALLTSSCSSSMSSTVFRCFVLGRSGGWEGTGGGGGGALVRRHTVEGTGLPGRPGSRKADPSPFLAPASRCRAAFCCCCSLSAFGLRSGCSRTLSGLLLGRLLGQGKHQSQVKRLKAGREGEGGGGGSAFCWAAAAAAAAVGSRSCQTTINMREGRLSTTSAAPTCAASAFSVCLLGGRVGVHGEENLGGAFSSGGSGFPVLLRCRRRRLCGALLLSLLGR